MLAATAASLIGLNSGALGSRCLISAPAAVADPDLELRRGGGGGGGLDLLALPAISPSVISFFTQNRRGARPPRAPPLDPPLLNRPLKV